MPPFTARRRTAFVQRRRGRPPAPAGASGVYPSAYPGAGRVLSGRPWLILAAAGEPVLRAAAVGAVTLSGVGWRSAQPRRAPQHGWPEQLGGRSSRVQPRGAAAPQHWPTGRGPRHLRRPWCRPSGGPRRLPHWSAGVQRLPGQVGGLARMAGFGRCYAHTGRSEQTTGRCGIDTTSTRGGSGADCGGDGHGGGALHQVTGGGGGGALDLAGCPGCSVARRRRGLMGGPSAG
mmetsp:Transcript_40230/g.113922  ORF Transcript_40230/g.113922 Transcript_40230/m.113922 type:complete len:232 (+) Transcript_40230:1597-2292(+)